MALSWQWGILRRFEQGKVTVNYTIGATLTSKAYLQGIENVLKQAQE